MADTNDQDIAPNIPVEVTDSGLIELAGIINSKSLKEMRKDRVDYIISKI